MLVRKLPLKNMIRLEGSIAMLSLLRILGIHCKNVRDASMIARTKQAVNVNQAGKRPRRECATAESEEKNLIAVFIRIHQIPIRISDVIQ